MRKVLLGVGLLSAIAVGPSHAAVAVLSDTKITGLLITAELDPEGNTLYGGCMARISKRDIAAETGLDCPTDWVTFSCSGDFLSLSDSSRLLNAAQMADALDLSMNMVLDDSRKHNGFCLSTRVQFR